MEEDLHAHLSASCAFPIIWGHFGPGTATPRAAIYRIGATPSRTLDGPGLTQTRVQIDAYGDTYEAAIGASRAIRAALEGHKGGAILGAFLDSVRDGNAEDVNVLARVSLTFLVTHRD